MPKIRSIMIYEIVECELVGLEVINQLKINEQNEYFESLNNIKIEKNSTQIEGKSILIKYSTFLIKVKLF